MTESMQRLRTHRLALQLKSVPLSELALVEQTSDTIFIYDEGYFQAYIQKGDAISIERLKDLQMLGIKNVFTSEQQQQQIQQAQQNALIKLTRSLSIGEPLAKSKKQTQLLNHNMQQLYLTPHDDQLLTLQYQSTSNLGKFLLQHKHIPKSLYQDSEKKPHNYFIKQPLLSSLLLLSFLKHSHLFSDKDIESLFITSYLKDLGMSYIPQDIMDKPNIAPQEKLLLDEHPKFSVDLLNSRLPINRQHLEIIQNHHYLNHAIEANLKGQTIINNTSLLGAETVLISAIDIIVAMTCSRPYRKEYNLYQALELVKGVLANQYPSEFKALIHFLRQFFSNK